MNFNFSDYNNIASQVRIQNKYDSFIYEQAIEGVIETYGRIDRKEQTQRVTESVRQIRSHHFTMLTTKSITHGSKDLGISGAELLRVEHPQLATALAIQQQYIVDGMDSGLATVFALSKIGAGRPALTEQGLTSVHEKTNRIAV